MQKTIIFAFQGNPLCFIHVLLNALNMAEQGMEGKIILEGEAVKLVSEMAKSDHFLHTP
ncbi:MAG: cytoplasmic protein, partial [Candidatus Electrothrix sp. ATG2]|nr:cytoplasmic protein [Candidatus Electrothrix sp. ATG2]